MYNQRSIYSLAQQKKTAQKQKIISIVVAAVGLILLLVSILMPTVANAIHFNPVDNSSQYAYIDVIELYYFDNVDSNGDRYYIAGDVDNYLYIVKINDDEFQKYALILDYSYGETSVKPSAVRVEGKPGTISTAVMYEALGEINEYYTFFSSYIYDEASFNSYFGYYYLDSTKTGLVASTALLIAGIAGLIAGIALLVPALIKSGNAGQTAQIALARYGPEAGTIDYELNLPTTLAMDDIGVYITPHYFISTLGGMQIDRTSEVANISSSYMNNQHMLNLSTTDGRFRPIAGFADPMQADTAFTIIKGQMDNVLSGAPRPVMQQPVMGQPAAMAGVQAVPPTSPYMQGAPYGTMPAQTPTAPTMPTTPVAPTAPILPQAPIQQTPPIAPLPVQPAVPAAPQAPVQPAAPAPAAPAPPFVPPAPAQQTAPVVPQTPDVLSAPQTPSAPSSDTSSSDDPQNQ